MVQNRQQTDDWTLIGPGAIGLGIQECIGAARSQNHSSHAAYILPYPLFDLAVEQTKRKRDNTEWQKKRYFMLKPKTN